MDNIENKRVPSENVREILKPGGQVAIIWSIEDVQSIRSDLNKKQAWDVLERSVNNHDASIGVSWDTLEIVAGILFPETPIEGGS